MIRLHMMNFYEIMKDETYSVGKPKITGSGLMRCIQFPAVDKYKIQLP